MSIFDIILPTIDELTKEYENKVRETKDTDPEFENLDLTKKEDYDKAVAYLEDIKKDSLVGTLLGDEYIDDIITKVDETYAKALAEKEPEDEEEIDLPSNHVSKDALARITFLADKYIEDQFGEDLDKEDEKTLKDELIEFGSWMLNYKD
jgi:BMFP domain-containing protein YqiC